MRKVAVIGAGQAGLIFAHYLIRHGGYEVTIYSDRTPDEWLNKFPPTGTAYLYGRAIDFERELGLAFWDDEMFVGNGVLLDFCPEVYGEKRMILAGQWPGRGGAVDQRLKASSWLMEAERRGGKVVYEAVTPDRLDEIAGENELTVLATGKADLANLIPRDPERSVYDAPQRNLAMCILKGVEGWDKRVDFTPVKFNFFGDAGEYFWVPYTHKTEGATWCVLFEAKPDSPLDKFGDVSSHLEMAEVTKEVIKDVSPWEWEAVKGMQPIKDDPFSWLKGRFPPTVRQACGRTKSGHLVMPVGDNAMLFDPIGGQGGNCASRNAWYTANEVMYRREEAFDEEWMEEVRNGFWEYHGKAAYTFNNILLEPLTEAGAIVLETACKSRQFSDDHFIGNFPYPRNFFPWMEDVEAAKQVTAPYL